MLGKCLRLISRLGSRAEIAFWLWTRGVLTWQQLGSVLFYLLSITYDFSSLYRQHKLSWCSAVLEEQSYERRHLMKRTNNPHCGFGSYSRMASKYPLVVGLHWMCSQRTSSKESPSSALCLHHDVNASMVSKDRRRFHFQSAHLLQTKMLMSMCPQAPWWRMQWSLNLEHWVLPLEWNSIA